MFVFSAVLLSGGLVEAIRIRYRSQITTVPTDRATQAFGRLAGDLVRAARYVRRDRRLLLVIGLVAAHCSFTMAFDSMMPTMAEKVGGSATLYSSILVGLGSGAIVGTLVVSQLTGGRSRGAMFASVGVGSGVAMVVMGTATTGFAVVGAAVIAGFTQAAYMTMSATLVQTIVTDDFRGRVMSVYIMIAAGHMAILNLGFGRVAETVDVRILLVGPGLLWIAVFGVGYVALSGVRDLVHRGRFDSMEPLPIGA